MRGDARKRAQGCEQQPGHPLTEQDRQEVTDAIYDATAVGRLPGMAVVAAVEVIVARHVAAERERWEKAEAERDHWKAVAERRGGDLDRALGRNVELLERAMRSEAERDEARAEVERLREILTPDQEVLDGISITWQSRARRLAKELTEARAERDTLRAAVAALADEWTRGRAALADEWTRGRVRDDETPHSIRALLDDPDAALAADRATTRRQALGEVLRAIDEDMGHRESPEVPWRDGYLSAMDRAERIVANLRDGGEE